MSELSDRHCVPCRGGVPPLAHEKINELLQQVDEWQAVNDHHLLRTFKLENYAQALRLVNRISEVAEEQGHHPDICFGWGNVEVKIWTHKINGLTESDFILAAKIDDLNRQSSKHSV